MSRTKASHLDSYGKFKIDQQKEFKNNVWTSYPIINDIKQYIKTHNLTFKTALDPCCGSCRLIKEFNEYEWTGYEINETIISECVENPKGSAAADEGHKDPAAADLKKLVHIDDFLKTDINDHFDLCVCNPPYCKNGGINNWVKKILSCCDMLFLIVPYNFITKISQQKNLIDVIHVENGMDENYHTCIKVYVFTSQEQETGFYEIPENSLFYLNKHIKKHKGDEVIYLRDFLEYLQIKTQPKKRIDTIPNGTKYPVYTIANNPVKYTDEEPNCPDNVILLNHSYLASCNTLKYSDKECYLNDTFGVYKVKTEKQNDLLQRLCLINAYLLGLFKLNNCNVVLKQEDILNIPIFINMDKKEQFLNEQLEEHMKRFKFNNLIKSKKIEWY